MNFLENDDGSLKQSHEHDTHTLNSTGYLNVVIHFVKEVKTLEESIFAFLKQKRKIINKTGHKSQPQKHSIYI